MEPLDTRQSWPDDEPTHPADIIFDFIVWLKQRGYTFNDLTNLAEQFKEQYQD